MISHKLLASLGLGEGSFPDFYSTRLVGEHLIRRWYTGTEKDKAVPGPWCWLFALKISNLCHEY
jgi:hypothetical protein